MAQNGVDTSGLRSERLRRAIDKLPLEAIRTLKERGDVVLKSDPYYSKGRISMAVSGSGPYTYAFSKGEISLFDYAQGEAMTAAGFPAAAPYDKATKADTNLLTKNETVNNEWVFVDGISFAFSPKAEPEILRQVMPEMYCSISMMGTSDFIKLGNPLFLGGGPGVFGGGESRILTPNAFDVRTAHQGFLSNGVPDPTGYKQLSDPLLWGPKTSSDSNLRFVCEVTRNISFTSDVRAAAATPGVPLFTPPVATGADGTFLEFWVIFHAVQVGSRSRNR